MSIRKLDHLFRPSSVVAIGASKRPNSMGATVRRSLLHAGFGGAIMPVNPKHATVAGVLSLTGAWPPCRWRRISP